MVSGATKQYELTSVQSVLYDVISSNLTDPHVPKRQKPAEWIKDGFPNPGDLNTKDGWDFPLVIIPYSELSNEIKALDGSTEQSLHKVSIAARAKTKTQAAEISEEIKHILTTSYNSELKKAAVFLTGINGTSTDSDFIGTIKFYEFTIDYNFQRFD